MRLVCPDGDWEQQLETWCLGAQLLLGWHSCARGNSVGLLGLCRCLNVGARVRELWLALEELQMDSLCEWQSQALPRKGTGWFLERIGAGSVDPGTCKDRVQPPSHSVRV